MTVTTERVTVDDIVDDLWVHVWTLVRAGMTDAAMVLLEASVDDFLAASAPEPESEQVVVLEGIVLDPLAPRCEVAPWPTGEMCLV